mmetsp:Transcript_33003/g.36786  ORF Transcript_33003/g.36786 Transcript_33003/m.36786 type:complete len:82 (-) Transcript_33003:708-953(-)
MLSYRNTGRDLSKKDGKILQVYFFEIRTKLYIKLIRMGSSLRAYSEDSSAVASLIARANFELGALITRATFVGTALMDPAI